MRKILKTMLSAVIICITAIIVSVCAYAETEDVELITSTAKTTNGAWGQSVTYPPNIFDCTRITPDTIVMVEFELDGEWTGSGAPVELILQNYTAEPQIWAKTEPFEYDDTSASFKYDDMVAAYGSDDFSEVGNFCLGDCGIVMKATKFTVTNCTVIEVTTTTEATTTEAATEASTEAVTTAAETTTAAPANNNSSTESGGKIPLIPIVIGAVVVAVIVVVIIIVKRSKQRFY